ncbi:MAG TPA: ATP-binding protein [Candidatus Sulfotelmatobacter sp.]
MMRKLSIGLRLALWYLAIFAVAQIIFGGGMWFLLRHNLYDIADDALENQVEDLKNFLQTQQKNASVATLQAQVAENYTLEHSGDYLQVETSDHQPIYRSAFLQAHPLSALEPKLAGQLSFTDRALDAKPLRFATARIEVNGRVYLIASGILIDDVVDTLSLFRIYLLMFAPLILLAAAGAGYWLSHRALAPVDAIVQTAREVSGTNLSSRLQKLDSGDELQRLSDTLNEMLDRLESAFLRITQFTADASHELRTPISLIRTEAELALRHSRREEEYKESLRHILLEAERTTSLIEELLALARADSGREALKMRALDLGETLRGTVESWQQIATIRNLQFSARIDAEEVLVLGDCEALRRVVDVLLDNAFKYTPAPGMVDLSLKRTEERAVITIRDSGMGIPPEEQSRIFERFYRVDKARSRELGGSGLGLSIAQWIVLQHQGLIRVESVQGNGSTFCVELPLRAAAVQDSILA